MEKKIVVIREPESFYFQNFELWKILKLKHEIKFTIKINKSLAKNKTKIRDRAIIVQI